VGNLLVQWGVDAIPQGWLRRSLLARKDLRTGGPAREHRRLP